MPRVYKKALALIKSQEQRIKELTEKFDAGNKEYIRLDNEYRILNAKYIKLTEENEAWQKSLITQKENADKAYYELACEVENLRAENERLREDNEIKSQKRANIFEIVNAFGRGRTDGVCKIREQFKERHEIWEEQDVTEYNYATSLLDQIAKEMLEDKPCT